MTTKLVSKNSASELNHQIEQHLKELAEATDKARTSEEMIRYLDFCAKFHQYSAGNIWLILIANPQASYVAGYHKWKSMGRWVRKGEHGIPILAPLLVKREEEDGIEEKQLVGFRVVYVYDVSQTDGDSLPPIPDWKSPEKNEQLREGLLKFANENGILVTFKDLDGEVQGISKGGEIDIDPNAGTKTLIHEIAHELLHQVDQLFLKPAIKELEAESVAYVVSKYFGLLTLNSPNYLALNGVSSEQFVSYMERIQKISSLLIKNIENNHNNDNNKDD